MIKKIKFAFINYFDFEEIKYKKIMLDEAVMRHMLITTSDDKWWFRYQVESFVLPYQKVYRRKTSDCLLYKMPFLTYESDF